MRNKIIVGCLVALLLVLNLLGLGQVYETNKQLNKRLETIQDEINVINANYQGVQVTLSELED